MKHAFQSNRALRAASLCALASAGVPAFGAPLPPKTASPSRVPASPKATAKTTAPKTAPVLISELRINGPAGNEDSFVELFNHTSKPISLSGWSLRFRDEDGATASLQMKPGTQIEPRGHLLLVGRDYSLGSVAKGDVQLGVTLRGGVSLHDAKGKLIDAAGPKGEGVVERESIGLPAIAFVPVPLASLAGDGTKPLTPQFSCVRKAIDGQPQDTNDNAVDFTLVSVSGALRGQKVQIGAPGPENAASPRLRPLLAIQIPPARRDVAMAQPVVLQTDAERNSMRRARREIGRLKTFGTMTLSYRFRNDSPNVIKSLSFRVNDITANPDTDPILAEIADVRLIRGKAAPQNPLVAAKTSEAEPAKTGAAPVGGAKAAPPRRTLWVWKAKLATNPGQPLGGGLNALLEVELPATGIAPGASGEVVFSFGVERRGAYRIVLSNQSMNLVFEGHTEDDLLPVSERQSTLVAQRRKRSFAAVGRNGSAKNNGAENGETSNASTPASDKTEDPPAASFLIEGHTEDNMEPEPLPPSVNPSAKAS